jgi:hypothetical protein
MLRIQTQIHLIKMSTKYKTMINKLIFKWKVVQLLQKINRFLMMNFKKIDNKTEENLQIQGISNLKLKQEIFFLKTL